MIFAGIELLVPYSPEGVYVPACSFRLPDGKSAVKLTIQSLDDDAIVQVREGGGDFPLEAHTTEQAAYRGFTSIPYVTPITGFRFRAKNPGTTTRVTYTAYG